MNALHALRLLAVAGLAPWLSATALAQEGGCCHGSLGAGAARAKLNAGATAREPAGVTASAIERDDRDTTHKLFGG